MIVDEESAKELFNLVISVFNESSEETTIICQNILKKINHFSNTSHILPLMIHNIPQNSSSSHSEFYAEIIAAKLNKYEYLSFDMF